MTNFETENMNIVGRLEEQRILSQALLDKEPQLIAVYGRRRIGKTYLIKSFFENRIKFVSLIGNKRLKTQHLLLQFRDVLLSSGLSKISLPIPNNWNEAFKLLSVVLENSSEPVAIFIDEVPWFDKAKSNFLGEFEHFWNSYGSSKENLKIILCGSATSWMLKKLIYNKAGLHNRFTTRINLKPFSLEETKEFITNNGIRLSERHILELYLAIGGVAEYLKWIKQSDSSVKIIEDLCFRSSGNLYTEYEALIPALFTESTKYDRLIEALSRKTFGLTFSELESGSIKGTTLKRMLSELELNSFISSYSPYGWGKLKLFRLTDPYLLFYHKWIKPVGKSGIVLPEHYWMQTFNSQSFRTWMGYSYETFCFTHVEYILKRLGISGMKVKASVWRSKKTKDGAQVDLVLERADRIINLCEIKYSSIDFIFDDKVEQELYRKLSIFKEENKIKYEVIPVLIASSKVINKNSTIEAIQEFR